MSIDFGNKFDTQNFNNIKTNSQIEKYTRILNENNNSNNIEDKFKKILDGKFDNNPSVYFSEKEIDKLPQNYEEKKLLQASIELEALFINQMYKSMKSSTNKENDLLYGGMTEDIFSDMLYDEYSLLTSKTQNLGIAKKIYTQMLNNIRNTNPTSNIINQDI